MPVDTVILRTRLLLYSAKYTFLLESSAIPLGALIVAEVACMLSPLYPADPVPAIVEITQMEFGLNEG